jgi:hypothetical protein
MLGIILLAAVLYLEMANQLDDRLPAAKLAKQVVGSRISNLIVYEMIAVLMGSGLLIWYLKSPLYSQFVLIAAFGIFVMYLTVAGLNKIRFDPVTISKEHIAETYFKAIEDKDPEEGIDYIIDYIHNPKWGVPETDLRLFLTQMAKRDDEYGRIARKRMTELGIGNDNSIDSRQ